MTNKTMMVAAFSIAAVMFGGAVGSSQAKKTLAQPVRVSTKVDRPLLIENGGQQEVVIQVAIDGLVRKRVRRRSLEPGGGAGSQWIDGRG
ncbi:MAG: hypothetical protein QM496_11785 [Verrucomicrobiota bacterium]